MFRSCLVPDIAVLHKAPGGLRKPWCDLSFCKQITYDWHRENFVVKTILSLVVTIVIYCV
jgi:hypothetical protein